MATHIFLASSSGKSFLLPLFLYLDPSFPHPPRRVSTLAGAGGGLSTLLSWIDLDFGLWMRSCDTRNISTSWSRFVLIQRISKVFLRETISFNFQLSRSYKTRYIHIYIYIFLIPRFKPGRDIGSLEALLDRLSLRMDLPRGARHIFSMDGDRKLTLDELEDGASYVVSSYKTFKVSGKLVSIYIMLYIDDTRSD